MYIAAKSKRATLRHVKAVLCGQRVGRMLRRPSNALRDSDGASRL